MLNEPPQQRQRTAVIASVIAVIALAVGTIVVVAHYASRPPIHGTAIAATDGTAGATTTTQPATIDLSGDWTGTYTCLQGLTSLDLVVTQTSPTAIGAVFNFSAHPTNPGVESGSYSMSGTFDPASKAVSLKATQWLNQPPGYRTVDLQGLVSSDLKTMSGQVVNASGCTTFMVQRHLVDQ
jgi:hypothetical protein